MACGVAFCFLFYALLKSLCEVHACLVGQGHENPQNVGHLFGRVLVFALLKALVAIAACHDAGKLAHLFCEARHVGEFREIAHAVGLYPFVHGLLCFAYCHFYLYSLFLVSMQMVTGPSLSNSTFMSAPNSPVPTGLPKAEDSFVQNSS